MQVISKALALCLSCVLLGCGGGSGGSGDSASVSNAANTYAPPTTSFSGVVTDSNGAPLSGVTIIAFLTNDHTERSATTDVSGRYSFSGLSASFPYGNYELRADKTGFGFLPSIQSGNGAVIKSDYNALFRTVIAISSHSSLNVTDANFTALRSSDKLVDLPRTGQSISYVSGDDASLSKGVAWPVARFTDNSDGTITDQLTGLVWLKNAGCFAASNWADALAAANQLANGACGLSDGSTAGQWRMPNVGELESLVDASTSSPSLPSGHPFTNVATTYWTSTTYRGVTSNAWVIRLTDGRYINDSTGNVKSGSMNSLWTVRSGTSNGAVKLPATGQFIVYAANDDASLLKGVRMPYPRFIDNGNGTLTDLVTGLVWMKRADCIHQSWSNAIAAIDSLANGQCGLSDGSTAGQWRMPNRAEMLSLVDRAETNQALRFNTTFYKADGSVDQAPVFTTFYESEFYWTSTTDAFDTSSVWTLFSCDFGVYDIAKANVGYSLAVR